MNKTKKMAKAGATLDKKPTIVVAVLAGVLGVMFILFGILEVRPAPLFISHVLRCRASEDTPPTQSTAPYTSQSSTHSRLLFFSTKNLPSLVSLSPPSLPSSSPKLTFLSSAIGAALFLVSIVIYLVGSFKLQKTVGKGNKTAVAVGKLTRNIACSLILSVLGTAAFTVISPMIDTAPYDSVPIGMIVANFLMPMGFTSGHFLLIQFIFNSLTRKKGQAKGGVAATQAGSTTVGNTSAGSTKAKDTSISAVHPKVAEQA